MNDLCTKPVWSGEQVASAVLIYFLTNSIVLAGALFAARFIPRGGHDGGVVSSLANWDGNRYAEIVEVGYAYRADGPSNVAFFPAFPMAGRAIRQLTGISAKGALLIVSHISLFAVFILLGSYLPAADDCAPAERSQLVLLAFGLWPTGVFFRMAYSESLFLLVTLLAMYGISRRWNVLTIAMLVGLATACRPVGVGLLPVLALCLWDYRKSTPAFLCRAAVLLPIGSWGILAFMGYQYAAFGDPFAFVKMHQLWALRDPAGWLDYSVSLLTLEPIWSVYVPSSLAYWANFEQMDAPLFSLQFANPVWFVATALLIGIGGWKQWLNRYELLLSAGLLLVPYVTHSYQAAMMSHGRYAAAVFPAYVVLGRLLAACSPVVLGSLCAFSGTLLALYSALFAASYRIV